MAEVRGMGTMGMEEGRSSTMTPEPTDRDLYSTVDEAIYVDAEGNVVGTRGPTDRIPPGAVTKLSRKDYEMRVKAGIAKAIPKGTAPVPHGEKFESEIKAEAEAKAEEAKKGK